MFDNTFEKIAFGFFVTLVGILLVWVVVMLPFVVHAEKICAEHAWPSGEVQYNLDMSCTREINETEYICPLEDVLAGTCVFDYGTD